MEIQGTRVLGERLWTGPLALPGSLDFQGAKGSAGTTAPPGPARPDSPAAQGPRAGRAPSEKQGPPGCKVRLLRAGEKAQGPFCKFTTRNFSPFVNVTLCQVILILYLFKTRT